MLYTLEFLQGSLLLKYTYVHTFVSRFFPFCALTLMLIREHSLEFQKLYNLELKKNSK